MRSLSLRARLLIAVISLAAAGLVLANVVTFTSLRSFLLDRADRTLDESARSIRGPGRDRSAPPGVAVQLRSADGTTVIATLPALDFPGAEQPDPQLPDTIEPPTDGEGRESVRYFTVPGQEGGSYRVRASLEERAEAMLVVASSLDEVDSTLDRLIAIEIIVTLVVLGALVALGLWLVRVGLRPLDDIGRTAAAIAGGDLSRRVERDDDRTEVGRLGHSLNTMLGTIESSFRAQEASERKLRRFVADASHELRTPLAAVRAYAELYGRGAAERPDDLERSMRGISRESERMSLLVDDLLLLARLDDGRPLERDAVALDEVVGEAVETAQAVEPDRPIALAAEHLLVLGDRDRLRQIVDNLLANVRAHTPAGTAVAVSLRPENGDAVLEVADRGPGLAPEELEHVFERFYRADPSRARASGGAGLGLSIVAAVAEAHGGRVAARSAPEGGAVFTVVVPLAPGARSQGNHGVSPATPATLGAETETEEVA